MVRVRHDISCRIHKVQVVTACASGFFTSCHFLMLNAWSRVGLRLFHNGSVFILQAVVVGVGIVSGGAWMRLQCVRRSVDGVLIGMKSVCIDYDTVANSFMALEC